jgi:hypothetical protein
MHDLLYSSRGRRLLQEMNTAGEIFLIPRAAMAHKQHKRIVRGGGKILNFRMCGRMKGEEKQ